jgi:myo-inositol 2-dehydrogenase/D-chiro-inositol 1-dehydrogenase
MIRYGLAGLGVHGMRYARHLLAGEVEGARLVGVSRADEREGREFAGRHGLVYTADPRELAALPGLDAVAVALPPDLHPVIALACIESGRPVLVEKPLAADARSAARVALAAERSGVPLMVAQTLRFDAVVLAIRREAESLGPLRVLAISQRLEPFTRAWLDRPGPGGVLANTAVHGFDLMRFLTGAEPVTVQAELGAALTRDTEDQIAAVVRLEPGGILATLDSSRATRGRSARIEVAGDGGQVAGDHVHRTLHRIRDRGLVDLGPVPERPTVLAVLRSFTECLAAGRPPEVTAADGRIAVEMVEAARLSAATGRRVSLGEVRRSV